MMIEVVEGITREEETSFTFLREETGPTDGKKRKGTSMKN